MPLFNSRSHDYNDNNNHNNHNNSVFSRHKRNSSVSSTDSDVPARSRTLGSRFRRGSTDVEAHLAKDPNIKGARAKVTAAEQAEREADKALDMAHSMVREARQHVKNLENAAREEIRRARAKHQEAKSISKGAKRLGRHDNH